MSSFSSNKLDSSQEIPFSSNHLKYCSTPGTENERGTGLGLILCKDFIEKHKGKIWVESEIHKGSTFYFGLPKK